MSQQNPEQNRQDEPEQPIIPSKPSITSRNQETSHSTKTNEKLDNKPKGFIVPQIQIWVPIIATVAIAIFTGKLLYVAEEQALISKRSLEILDTSVNISKQAAETYRRVSATELRPYLFFETVSFADIEVGRKPQVLYEVINHGKTPAYFVNSWAEFSIGTEAVEKWKQDPNPTDYVLREGFVLPPAERPFPFRRFWRTLTAKDSVKLASGHPLFAMITVFYRDHFDTVYWTQSGFINKEGEFNAVHLSKYTAIR